MTYHRIKRIIVGAAFELPKRGSRVTVEYQLIIDVPASKSWNGRRDYVSADIGFTATSADVAVAEAYDHAERTVKTMLTTMLKKDDSDD